MKKSKWKGYAPVLAMASLAVVLGVLTLCGVIDLGTLPQLVADKPALAVLVALGLYALKGISVAVVYHVLVVSVATVRSHVHAIYTKTGVHSAAELAKLVECPQDKS